MLIIPIHQKTLLSKAPSLTEMQTILKEKYNVEMKIQNKNISFLHPDKESYCGAKKLGNDYTKEILERGLEHGSKKE